MEKYVVRLTKEEYAEKVSEDFQRLREISRGHAAECLLSVQNAAAEKRCKAMERQQRCRAWRKLVEVEAGLWREDSSHIHIPKVC
jgi:hypothetical protein